MKALFAQIDSLSDDFLSRHSEDARLLFDVLVIAEDRRARWHVGVDIISIARALFVATRTGRVRGVSTIEQQLVRTLRPRRRSAARSKPMELVLATGIGLRFSKCVIWAAYLNAAYYGADWETFDEVIDAVAANPEQLSPAEACTVIAYLKYPKPEDNWPKWTAKHSNRSVRLMGLYASRGRDRPRTPLERPGIA